MAPDEIVLEVGGQSVTVMVEREQLQHDLAADGYPADRSVYVITWNEYSDI